MGSYSSFRIGSQEIYSVKNEIDPLLMSLFRPHEKVVRHTTVGAEGLEPIDETLGSDEPLTVVEYRTTAGAMRDRLDLMGFTLAFAQRAFELGKAEQLASDRNSAADIGAGPSGVFATRIAALEQLTFPDWQQGFRFIIEHGLIKRVGMVDGPDGEGLPHPVPFMLHTLSYDLYGFPVHDTRVFLRAALAAVDANTPVVEDLTDLVQGGWFDTADDLNEHADYLVTADFATTQRLIVLTEGSSDKRILEAALAVRRPHLGDYFSFMDFDELRVPGGAGSVVSFVKAFAAAGVINRVIAILDNDTAASSALRALRGVTLPKNVRVIRLPDLEELRSYPTLGPTGVSDTNVNGLAASLELYLGRDVLSREDGTLTPVQWRGYDEALRQYQGEVLNKADLHQRFMKKVQLSSTAEPPVAVGDWSSLDAVLDALCAAYHDADPIDWIGA